MRVVSCLVNEHNLWLVCLALTTCLSGSWTALRLFSRVMQTRGSQRLGWTFLAAGAGGATIWGTHFIAMLAYQGGTPVVVEPILTLFSLVIAIAGVGAGFLFVASSIGRRMPPIGPWIGGAMVGLASSAMHYMGMVAYRIEGIVTWDGGYVIASVALAILIGSAAMTAASRKAQGWNALLAPGLLAAATLSLHFTGMAAVSVDPLSPAAGASSDVFTSMAAAVAAVSLIIVGAGATSYVIDDSERAAALERYQQLALHDSLTGLPNRRSYRVHLDDELAGLRESAGKLGVVGIDLDRFKEINDTFGHAAGDDALKVIAGRLSGIRRPGEFIARLGGDEFAAVKRFENQADVLDFTSRIETAILKPMTLDGWETSVGASIGVAIYPEDGTDKDALVSNADLAMYRAKANIGQTICFYEPGMDEAARDRRNLANDLRAAVERKQLELHYQVQSGVKNGEIRGYEALLRWHHPQRGMIPPAEFIPIAEECGAILPIGEWVLRTACREAARFSGDIRIAVNLSAVQFAHADLARLVQDVLVETGLPAHRLELEITESTIIVDKQRTLDMLRRIKALGVTIAIDDFGTGYSSLDTLRSFPFDKIKLDRSFMAEAPRDPQAKAIVCAVLTLGRSLDIPVLAEGVETEDQLSFLRMEGYDEAQGYLLGLPAAIDRYHNLPGGSEEFAEQRRRGWITG